LPVTPDPWHWILDERKFSSTEKLVAIAIVRHQSAGRAAWPSVARLAEITGKCERTVQRALRNLEAASALKRWRTTGGRGKTAFYRMEQSQALLFSSANSLWKNGGNPIEALEKGDIGGTQNRERVTPVSPGSPVNREYRKERETPRADAARALWKTNAKANRILGEIAYLRATAAGCGPSDLVHVERVEVKIRALLAQLPGAPRELREAG
jgi:Helix-turn-helix domain